jgi:uncharacterized protein (TIGR02118 family)
VATFVALYEKPEDVAGFEDHFRTVHVDLMRRWPGVQSVTVTRFSGTPRGAAAPFHLMAVVTFASDEEMAAALRSDAGADAVRDAKATADRFGVAPVMLLGEPFGERA